MLHAQSFKDRAGQRHGSGDPSAFFQIFQGVDDGHDPEPGLFFVQPGGNGFRRQAFLSQLQTPHEQDPLANGGAETVHHEDPARIVGSGDDGALVCAGKLGGEGDHHDIVAGGHQRLETIGKNSGRKLGSGRQFPAGSQLFKKFPVAQIHGVPVSGIAKGDGQRQNGYAQLRCLPGQNIRGGINDKMYAHR